jgi:hypothetical protein
MSTVKFPNVKVNLIGQDSNAFAIMASCTRAARKEKIDPLEIKLFQEECMSSDYNGLLRTCMKWFSIQ